ncbi:putative transposase [Rosistilla carotiformis]|uniref:Putative transposase n=1 Tax=Rosistilla carotiformis TaxID=2528017 RepID=A0A518JM00_9BACT|nr:Rpn family recombination-promoting nuclease/putative transposase [Rosistilla carotiformis]QDV66580.1 putative transposase [Rosistilla carotiformis]
MSDDAVNNPHDRFVRRFLGEIDQVRQLVLWRLPPEVVAELDLDTIAPAKQSFVDQTLRESLSDLVFEVALAGGGEALVVLLFEHKSSPDAMTSFQVLRYIFGVLDQRQRDSLPLRCVIPIVLYHGVRPWNVARSLPELIDAPASLQPYVPSFTMPLIDLSCCTDEELRTESLFFAYMSLLKYIGRDELPERLPELLRLFRRLLPPATGLASLETILRYLVSGTDRVTRDQLRTAVADALRIEGENLMPTIAEQWLKEGIEKGVQAGVEKGEWIGRIRTLQEVLSRKVDSVELLMSLQVSELQQLAGDLSEALPKEGR